LHFLPKPLDFERLLTEIEGLIGKSWGRYFGIFLVFAG
jgi:hypothetical protein